ncbi:MAG: hypothetical protein M1812_003224 [Candelaria pacifica]|nr:MAG: hypothetical protein M1812_003224 [Candelaria pacifica]
MWSTAIFFFSFVFCFISTATAIPAARAQAPSKRDGQADGYIVYGVVVSSASLPVTSTTPPIISPEITYSTGHDLVKDIVQEPGGIAGSPFGGDAFYEIVSTTPVTSQISTTSSLPSSITSIVLQPSGASLRSTHTPPTRSSSKSWNATSQQPNNSLFPTPTSSASGSSSTSSNSNSSNSSSNSTSSDDFGGHNNTINASSANNSNSSGGQNSTINSSSTNSSNSSNNFVGYNSTSSSNSTNGASNSNTTTSASSSASPQPSVFVAPIPSSNSSSIQSNATSTSATGSGFGSSTSSSTMNSASATSSVPAAQAPASTTPSLSNSSIAGIAVGATAAFALLVTALGYIFRRRYYANLARKQQTYPKLAYLYDPPGQPPSMRTASTARLRPSGDGVLASGGFDNHRFMGYESPRIPSLPPPTPTMARAGEGVSPMATMARSGEGLRGLGIETESTPFEGFNPPPPPPPGFIHDAGVQQPPHQDMRQFQQEQLHRSPEIGSSETTPFIATAPAAAAATARRSTSPTLAGNSGTSSVKMEQREGTWWF